MRRPKAGRLFLLLIISLGLTACGTGKTAAVPATPVTPTPAQTPPTTLTGSWLLTGSRVPAVFPVVSISLSIQGNIVTGDAALSARCASGTLLSSTSSADYAISGTINTDGTFQASSQAPDLPGAISLSITGNSPLAATPSVWTGTYSLTSTPGTSAAACSFSQTAAFTATPIASVTGNYIGLPVNGLTPFGSDSVVSVQIVQGAPTLVTQGSTTGYRIPLTANLNIASSTCPFTGSTTGAYAASFIDGDSFTLVLTSVSPYGFLGGTLNDATANAFSADLTSVANTNHCSGIALYNFTRK